MIVEVSLSLNTLDNFSYEFRGDPDSLSEGIRVLVPVWNRISTGWIVNCKSNYKGRVKPVIGVIRDEFIPGEKFLEFVYAVSGTFMISSGIILDNSLSPGMRSTGNMYFRSGENDLRVIKQSLQDLKKISRKNELDIYYKIKGRDGSIPGELSKENSDRPKKTGKSLVLSYNRNKVYENIWKVQRSSGRSPVMLLPNNASMDKYNAEIQDLIIYNSKLKPGERENIWYMARSNDPMFIAGGESALFLPVLNPGDVIIEKPGSFYYDRNIYSGIDLRKAARLKAKILGLDIIEGNSTYTSLHYYNRDSISVRNERGEDKINISVKMLKPGIKTPPDQIIDSVINNYLQNKHVLVIVSKKGSSRFLFCSVCKNIIKCQSCGSSILLTENGNVNCTVCSYIADSVKVCNKCNSGLKIIEDVSVSSFEKLIGSRAGESRVFSVESEKSLKFVELLKRPEPGENNIVITTPVYINSILAGSFDFIVLVKPESFFDLNKYNGAEQIFSFISGLNEILSKDGKIDVHSVFHFHYALKLVNDEKSFFERELKYREFFSLPPYFELYQLELSEKDLRKLGKNMRNIFDKFESVLNIKKIFLLSRQKKRGNYKGIMHVHSDPETIIESGILKIKGLKIKGLL